MTGCSLLVISVCLHEA